MLGIKLCELAEVVGLTQTAIAERLGVAPPQVNRWFKGVRPIPDHVRTVLTAYVLSAVRRCIDEIDEYRNGLGPLARAAKGNNVADLRRKLIVLAGECLLEDMEAAAEGPTAAILGGLEALDLFKTMTPVELLKPANAEKLLQLAEALKTQAAVLCRISPMFDVLRKEEERHVDDRSQSRQSGAAGGAESSAE